MYTVKQKRHQLLRGNGKLALDVLGPSGRSGCKGQVRASSEHTARSSRDHCRPVLSRAGWGHVGMLVPPQAKVGDPAGLEQQTLGPLRESGGHGAGQMGRGE